MYLTESATDLFNDDFYVMYSNDWVLLFSDVTIHHLITLC